MLELDECYIVRIKGNADWDRVKVCAISLVGGKMLESYFLEFENGDRLDIKAEDIMEYVGCM